MKCIGSISCSVVINGKVGEMFKPNRGLRQGDPLGPFLFLICSESLSTLMKSALHEGILKGTKVGRKGPQITQLLFADDCVLFSKANEKGFLTLKQILREYKVCYG